MYIFLLTVFAFLLTVSVASLYKYKELLKGYYYAWCVWLAVLYYYYATPLLLDLTLTHLSGILGVGALVFIYAVLPIYIAVFPYIFSHWKKS